MFFLQNSIIGLGDLNVPRLRLPGIDLASNRTNLVFNTVVFTLLSAGVLAIRRGSFGRLLNATKDSQAACATLGLNLRLTKIALFALATAIATFGGAVYGSTQTIVTSSSFQYVYSLFIVLIVYIWGVSTPGAALAGGLSLALTPLLELHLPSNAHVLWWHLNLQPLTYFFTGFGALGLVLYPKGIIATTGDRLRALLSSVPSRPAPQPALEVSGATPADA
jgi:branched-chain amino acid transport system permease protein